MRKYNYAVEKELAEVICNKCGKALRVEGGILKEGCFTGNACFGYFSKRDGVRQRFDLCEDCFEELVKGFVVPAEEIEEVELC